MKLNDILESNVVDFSQFKKRSEEKSGPGRLFTQDEVHAAFHDNQESAQADFNRIVLPKYERIAQRRIFGAGNLVQLYDRLKQIDQFDVNGLPESERRQMYMLTQDQHLYNMLKDLNIAYNYVNDKNHGVLDLEATPEMINVHKALVVLQKLENIKTAF